MNCISIGKTLGRCILSNTFKIKRSHYESDKSAFMNPLGVSIVQIYNPFLDFCNEIHLS